MGMDEEHLLELIAEAQKRGGGILLNVGDSPQAVVLSVAAYTELLAGKPSALLTGNSAPSETVITTPKTLLITGGAGYVGAHVAREALACGYKVVVLDNLFSGKKEYVPAEAIFIEGDVRDINLLREIFATHAINAVVHLAALLEVGESVEKPIEYFETNTIATSRLLLAMKEAGVGRLIFSSTAAVYKSHDKSLLNEKAERKPTNPYGESKLMAERIIAYYCMYAGMQATVLRFFNVAGSLVEWGIFDTHKAAHLIPVVLDVAKGNLAILTVNGGDWETADKTCVRDYVHAHDVARAHMAVLDKAKHTGFRAYNVGNGHGFSVNDVVQTATEVTGRMIPMQVGPRRAGDSAELVADVSLIFKELGFKAQYSLEDIIKSAWQAPSA